MSAWTWWRREPTEDAAEAGLTFTDVLFGLVLAEVFGHLDEIPQISAAGRAHLILAFVLTTASYIGYHNSKKRSKYTIRFFNLPLFKFVLDMAMVVSYWWLAVNPEGVPDPRSSEQSPLSPPSAVLDSTVILVVFVLYVLWDIASWLMHAGGRYPKTPHSVPRMLASIGGLVIAAVVFGCVQAHDCEATDYVVGVDIILVGLLLAYRWVKDGLAPPAEKGT